MISKEEIIMTTFYAILALVILAVLGYVVYKQIKKNGVSVPPTTGGGGGGHTDNNPDVKPK
jgi:hypothetical protein